MIAIDHILVSDELITEQFVCDLNKCKGACCVDGDAGAPLEIDELKKIDEVFDTVKEYLNEESIAEINRQGRYVFDKEFGWVTPTINSSICVYGISGKDGIVKCSFEQAYNNNLIQWKKPVSCHLFPAIAKKSKNKVTEYLNYEPREDHCKPGCILGEKLKVPVYKFLKEPLVRKFGQEFYDALDATAEQLKK